LKLSDKIITFIESLNQPTGDNAGEPMALMEWQKNIIREVYDPVDSNGLRIVSEVVLSVARKNCKTTLCAGIGLAHLWLPDLIKINQQVQVIAWSREQAGHLFDSMASMIRLDDELIYDFNIVDSRKRITHKESGGYVKIETADAGTIHGGNPSLVLADECGNWSAEKGRDVYSTITTGFGARKESLIMMLSTQSATDAHFFSEKVDYGKEVNSGNIKDDSFKAFIYEVPEDADVFNERNWILANPAIDEVRSREDMRKKAKEAKQLPAMENKFRQLFCNQRVDSNAPFISRSVWKDNGGKIDFEALKGRACFGGLDLSSRTDLTSLVLVFPSTDKNPTFDVIPFFWKPEDLLKEQSLVDRVPYVTWHKQGLVEATPGKTIDYIYVAEKVKELNELYDIKTIYFDRWKIEDFKRDLKRVDCRVKLESCGQGYKDFSPAVDVAEQLLIEKRLRHNSNPVLTWCVANTVIMMDPAGNRKLNKKESYGRIDGTVALCMALRGWEILQAKRFASVYDDDSFYDSF